MLNALLPMISTVSDATDSDLLVWTLLLLHNAANELLLLCEDASILAFEISVALHKVSFSKNFSPSSVKF